VRANWARRLRKKLRLALAGAIIIGAGTIPARNDGAESFFNESRRCRARKVRAPPHNQPGGGVGCRGDEHAEHGFGESRSAGCAHYPGGQSDRTKQALARDSTNYNPTESGWRLSRKTVSSSCLRVFVRGSGRECAAGVPSPKSRAGQRPTSSAAIRTDQQGNGQQRHRQANSPGLIRSWRSGLRVFERR